MKTGNPIIANLIDVMVMAAEINRLVTLTHCYREDRAHDEYLRLRKMPNSVRLKKLDQFESCVESAQCLSR
ncbi:hypothetical protein ACQPZ2_00855 [Nocardia pseudovaccinii]|uniref:hypothetical protein n=1 Tax=Nocardia pseudovaccinii TaxID=189540 RepID=UPI003D8F252B